MSEFDPSFDRREGESIESFSRRLSLLRTLKPALDEVARRGIQVVVESARAWIGESGLDADYVLEFGDLRIRLVVLPGVESIDGASDLLDRAKTYLLNTPDTDAVALMTDAEGFPTLIVEAYTNLPPAGAELSELVSFQSAVARYFTANALAIEIPDFRTLMEAPTIEELETLLSRAISDSFERVVGSNARIPEKVNALESLGSADLARLIRVASNALQGADVVVEDILPGGGMT